jgi:hypothetical protein
MRKLSGIFLCFCGLRMGRNEYICHRAGCNAMRDEYSDE